MGLAKRWLEEVESRGFGDAGWSLCLTHILDDALAASVQSHLDERSCTFCGARVGTSETPIAVSGEEFMTIFMDSLCFFYVDPNDHLPWDGREGGYQGPVSTTSEAVEDLASNAFNDDLSADVIEALVDAIGFEKLWTPWGANSDTEDLDYSWDQFAEVVKHRHRFIFQGASEPGSDLSQVHHFLQMVGTYLRNDLGLVRDIPAGSLLYRGRLAEDPRTIARTAEGLGPPPREKAAAGRLSPAGIPMFYAAPDPQTAVAEIAGHGVHPYAVVGVFETLDSLHVIDFSKTPKRPSPFDAERRHEYRMASFLKHFVSQATRAIIPDDRQHYEYVPTQIVTEYLRHISERPLDGIILPSAQTDSPTHAYFADADRFETLGAVASTSHFVNEPPLFHLDPAKVKTYEVRRTYKGVESRWR